MPHAATDIFPTPPVLASRACDHFPSSFSSSLFKYSKTTSRIRQGALFDWTTISIVRATKISVLGGRFSLSAHLQLQGNVVTPNHHLEIALRTCTHKRTIN